MTHYVGIDLGTTNSAICSYDGEQIVLYKSPEQTDVTPSAIFVDRRGNRFVGQRAYDYAARAPDNVAKEFKRMMGSATPVTLSAVNLVMTPEQCSAEILKVLFGYLPEEIRNDPDVGTVITVPAAFNQMQKEATMEAAQAAGIGKVALMQEPVAAVMSVMQKRRADGIFLVFDIGGGTLDIAIAQSLGGRVSLLGQGGIAMCGGRDFDRLLVDRLVWPWLSDQFQLPDDFASQAAFVRLRRMAEYAAERAKIQLSGSEEAIIAASEQDLGVRDHGGREIYLDCPVTRSALDRLMEDKVGEAVEAARDAIEKAGVAPRDLGHIVFVGGPSQYKPLRDRVASALGVAASTEVHPMTAVAEGAAVFAETIDWSTHNRARKSARGSVSAGGPMDIGLNHVARTPDSRAKVALRLGAPPLPGCAFQIDSLDTGWSSGRQELRDGAVMDVPLTKPGPNVFKLFVFDPAGGPIALAHDRIVISRTAATVDAIPASHSIGIEARDKVGGPIVLEHLVRKGDALPLTGHKRFKAMESLRAGSSGALNFVIREGEIADPVSDNRFVGLFKITGDDFADGVIAAGAELLCEYEILDSGNLVLDVSVPSIGVSLRNKNFYSRREGAVDYSNAARRVHDDAARMSRKLAEMERRVSDPMLAAARVRLDRAMSIALDEANPETTKQAMDDVDKAKELLAKARRANLKVMRRAELTRILQEFDASVRRFAKPSEETSFDMLAKSAELAIDDPRPEFESFAKQLDAKRWGILYRQDWFVIEMFNWRAQNTHVFADPDAHAGLVADGRKVLAGGDVDRLRHVIYQMDQNRLSSTEPEELLAVSNIARG
jgi:molecular chaperone DnaK